MPGPARPPRPALPNIPLPEPHLAGIAVGLLLQRLRPVGLGRCGRARPTAPVLRARADAPLRAAGAASLAAGCGLIGWAWAAARQTPLARPESLVTQGPYAFSRNPMYVGWSMVHLGLALLRCDAWTLAALPVAAVAVHRQVLREEDSLQAAFGAAFSRYRAAVPRYVAIPR